MRDAAGPRDFLDEGVDDIQILELLFLSEGVTADHGDGLLDRSRAAIEPRLVLGVSSVEEDLDEPLPMTFVTSVYRQLHFEDWQIGVLH